MRTVPVSVLKAELAEQLRHVKEGEEVVVTERGRPVARLVPLPRMHDDTADLVARGVLRAGSTPLTDAFFDLPLPDDPEGLLRAAVRREREDRG